MKTIQVIENDSVYSCDIGVSKDEWLEILKETKKEYIETLLRFYYMPEHKGACMQVSRLQGDTCKRLNFSVTNFAKFVKKRLDRFEVVGTDGKPCFWIIPMNNGRELEKGDDGAFEWQLRKELVEALAEYLYFYLVKQYKLLRKEEKIDNPKYGELYKWKLIDDCKGKDTLFIVERLSETNLIDTERVRSVVRYMLNNKKDEYIVILDNLLDENLNLYTRLCNFKEAMIKVLPEKMNVKANDERTASAILTCHQPSKYTFYKNDVYVNFCQYLGIEEKYTGSCFEHFMKLIKPLRDIVANDEELQKELEYALKDYERFDLLLAQDILWMMFGLKPNKEWLDFIYSLVWKPRYWLVGFNFNDGENPQLDRFLKDGIWEGRLKGGSAQFRKSNRIKENDVLILKSTLTKGSKHDQPCLRVSAVGVVTKRKENVSMNDGLISISCAVNYISCDVVDFDGNRYGQYLSTVNECKENEVIDYVNKIINMEPQKKYGEYIDLLFVNHNLVLTGAPGTGKTFMAKEIAKEMNAEYEMVQFHPSYDYTDFVEGLRPTEDGSFERRNGVFKAFCVKALENLINSKKSREALQQEISVRELIDNFIDEAIDNGITFETSGTKNIFHIIENEERKITIDIPNNEKANRIQLPKSDLQTLLENKVEIAGGKGIQEYFQRKYRTQQDSYVFVLYDLLRKRPRKKKAKDVDLIEQKNYIFVIDEINRGEISKIFGELFFSIDPGYRGEKGKVKTQYQNMIEEGDVFKDGFFVPENVYIIGTMNDIDRSVESMDFAMRRRFAWKEVTANESYTNMIEYDADYFKLKEEIHSRMTNLNKAICDEKLGLGEAYQIGAAYFRKAAQYAEKDPDTAFDQLWDNHLKGLLAEYLRGNRNAKEQLDALRKAYNKTEIEDANLNNR